MVCIYNTLYINIGIVLCTYAYIFESRYMEESKIESTRVKIYVHKYVYIRGCC